MKETLRNLIITFLLLIPVILINLGYHGIRLVYDRGERHNQELFASQKLGEMAAHIDIAQEISVRAGEYKNRLSALLREYSSAAVRQIAVSSSTLSTFAQPFPNNELWVFYRPPEEKECTLLGDNDKIMGRRSMEMLISYLLRENLEESEKAHEARRNEKLLQKIMGNGCSAQLLAFDNRGVATPIIYKRIPSYLAWDYTKAADGSILAFLLVVPRNQDLVSSTYRIAAKKTGLGSEFVGGFLRIYETGSPDCIFPARLAKSKIFNEWRSQLGVCRDMLEKWQIEGLPSAIKLGNWRLYSQILPLEKHLAVLLLPDSDLDKMPRWLKILNGLMVAGVIVTLLRGLLWGLWPFMTISRRFLVVFVLAVSLPVVGFVTSAAAYVFERLKADENNLERTLTTSLLDFDAGKEFYENEYSAAFSKMLKDDKVISVLAEKQLESGDEVLARVRELAASGRLTLPLSGIAVFDLEGNSIAKGFGDIHQANFATLARFYGHSFTVNLRRAVAREEPDLILPKHKVDERNLAALQSFHRNDGLEGEIERFRGKVIRTDFGRGHLSYLYDFISIGGRLRYALMISWFNKDIDNVVLKKAADQLGLKSPQIKIVAFTKSIAGLEPAFTPDRSVSAAQLQHFRRIADSAFAIKSGMLKTLNKGISVIAYASKHFPQTVIVAGIEHQQHEVAHYLRVVGFCLLGGLGLTFLLISGIVIFYRIVVPLKILKEAFDSVDSGLMVKLPDSRRQDEIGLLTREFTGMIDGLEQRHRLASLLSDQAVAAIAVAAEGTLVRSEQFNGVVMIADIRGFTAMCEQNEPQIITSLLNLHFAAMAEVIIQFGGRIYKFIGDAVEAVFVEDQLLKDSAPVRAVAAAGAMLQRLEAINSNRFANGDFTYRMGIGLADGELFAGETGSSESRRDYAIIGTAFKQAETLEAMTKKFPDLPILASPSVAAGCAGHNWQWQEEEIDKCRVMRLKSVSTVESLQLQSVAGQSEKTTNPLLQAAKVNKSGKIPLAAMSGSGWRSFIFAAGVLAIFFPVFSWLLAFWAGNEAELNRQQVIAAEYCENAKMKVSVADSQQVVFEQYIDNLSEEVAAGLGWNESGVGSDVLASAASGLYSRFVAEGLRPSLFAVLHKPGGQNIATFTPGWRLVSFHGPASLQMVTEELLKFCALRFYSGWQPPAMLAHFIDKVPLLTGNSMPFMFFFNDMFARICPIKRLGREEYLYWQPLFIRNNQKFFADKDLFAGDTLRRRPGPDILLQVGALMCIFPKAAVFKNHLANVVKILEYEPVEFAVIRKTQPVTYSAGFPIELQETATDLIEKQMPGWYTSSVVAKVEGEQAKLIIARKLGLTPGYRQNIFFVLLLVLAGFASIAWYRAVYRESGIAQKFAWQLWLGLIAAAIVPLSAFYTVNEWFAIELAALNPAQERVRLVRQFDALERRQFLQEVHAWDNIARLSNSPELQSAIAAADRGTGKERDELAILVNRLANAGNPLTERVLFSELLLFHKHGWKTAIYYDEKGKDESADFKRFVNAFADLLFADLGIGQSYDSVDKPLGGAVKDEMTREAGLDVFRTLFGSDAYFKLVHGVGLPIRAFVSVGMGCFKLLPVPSASEPEMILFWLFFDRINQTMRQIFKQCQSKYPVFTESKVMYGAIKQPWMGGFNPDIGSYARWALAKKSPFSSRTFFAGRESLVEARIGSHNEVMMMIGFISETEILEKIDSIRRMFLLLLILAILAIVLLSMIVTADVTGPVRALTKGVRMIGEQNYDYRIKTDRKDELGQILISFNQMARGLQEKELMSQMVSAAARKVASDADSLIKAEKGQHLLVTVLYLAVPEFSCLIKSMQSEQLIEEVRAHISAMCRIILDNGGEVDKIIGEKILAYFFSSEGLVKSNEQALAAMVCIRNAERSGNLALPITAGVHCGEVIAGLLGIGSKRDFTIIGDPVNTAARICARASELPFERFLVSNSVVAGMAPKREIRFREFGEVQLKGKSETVELSRVLFD